MNYKGPEHSKEYKEIKDRVVFTYSAQASMYKHSIKKQQIINILYYGERSVQLNGHRVSEWRNTKVVFREENNKIIIITTSKVR
ncbi:hypothetical protein L8C07_05825 [Paenibacillus sp. CMAA1739]|uniref:hypothetical protein n=1 Tax=Paenibacillus ottowii TaxID=2315729 RepID=UPI002DBCDB23|nr:hypothetical protein [Paenibacillus sp. CMAA1739]MEC4565457.1 hypothetical protein [Paenibacillus sp. CMAA1739]